MISYGDHLAVAVSGGKDSITLLEVMAEMQRKYHRTTLTAVTVDEGIEGYRDEALEITVKTCERLQILHHVISFKQLYGFTLDEIVERLKRKGNQLTPCAFCGVLRRKAMNAAALEVKADKIATGHTLDDEVQTSLLNIFHGDVPKLFSEKPVTDQVHSRLVQKVKPLCEIPERESALYAYLRGFAFQQTPCPYAGEALRNDIRGLLNRIEERHAGSKFTVFKSIEKIRPAISEFYSKGSFKECIVCGDPAASDICMACQMIKQIR